VDRRADVALEQFAAFAAPGLADSGSQRQNDRCDEKPFHLNSFGPTGPVIGLVSHTKCKAD
jgi:hypothetical protein